MYWASTLKISGDLLLDVQEINIVDVMMHIVNMRRNPLVLKNDFIAIFLR